MIATEGNSVPPAGVMARRACLDGMTTKFWVLLGSVYAIGCGGGTTANHSACDAAAADCSRATAAWIVFNVKPDADCHDSSSPVGPSFPSGLFDIGGTAECEHPYVA